ncbi:MAG: hypothetical protein CL878_07610 [Dehalococcoidia bacterium]|nr:hypothetical protein [Dehalococcoidia bacterium]
MTTRLRTGGLWLLGFLGLVAATSLVGGLGGPRQDAAQALVEPEVTAAPSASVRTPLLPLGTLRPSRYAEARRVLRRYGEALQQHIEQTGLPRPRSSALQLLEDLDRFSITLADPPPIMLASAAERAALQRIELEMIALADQVAALGEAASGDDQSVLRIASRLEQLVERAESTLAGLRRAATG